MLQLKFVNARGKVVDALQMYDEERKRYRAIITGIDELHGVDNEFSSSTSPYFDGDVVDHIRTNPRTIILTYALRTPIEESLTFFKSIVKSKQRAKLIETRSDGSQIEIEGIVTVPPYTRISDQVSIQIQLYCSEPYWQDAKTIVTEVSRAIDMHYFPYENEEQLIANDGGLAFIQDDNAYTDENTDIVYAGIPFSELDTNPTRTITNDGDTATGMVIQIVATEPATNPRISRDSYNWIEVQTTMAKNDWIEISTVRGNKYIHSNIESVNNNIASILYSGNDWLQLETGDNEFNITARDPVNTDKAKNNAVYFSIYYKRKWQ